MVIHPKCNRKCNRRPVRLHLGRPHCYAGLQRVQPCNPIYSKTLNRYAHIVYREFGKYGCTVATVALWLCACVCRVQPYLVHGCTYGCSCGGGNGGRYSRDLGLYGSYDAQSRARSRVSFLVQSLILEG